MQINGAHLATTFLPKPTDCQESFSTPVIIEAAARRDEKIFTPVTVSERQTPPAITLNDIQQSRYVRLFATANEPSSHHDYQSRSGFSSLPRGVQQYLQVADLKSKSGSDRLFDETV